MRQSFAWLLEATSCVHLTTIFEHHYNHIAMTMFYYPDGAVVKQFCYRNITSTSIALMDLQKAKSYSDMNRSSSTYKALRHFSVSAIRAKVKSVLHIGSEAPSPPIGYSTWLAERRQQDAKQSSKIEEVDEELAGSTQEEVKQSNCSYEPTDRTKIPAKRQEKIGVEDRRQSNKTSSVDEGNGKVDAPKAPDAPNEYFGTLCTEKCDTATLKDTKACIQDKMALGSPAQTFTNCPAESRNPWDTLSEFGVEGHRNDKNQSESGESSNSWRIGKDISSKIKGNDESNGGHGSGICELELCEYCGRFSRTAFDMSLPTI